MLEQFVPAFAEHVFEGYNAKLPDEVNAYKNIDAFLKDKGFSRRSMPTATPQEKRFVYWNGSRRVVVTAYYAGRDIRVEIPGVRTEAAIAQSVLQDFINRHLLPYIEGKTPLVWNK